MIVSGAASDSRIEQESGAKELFGVPLALVTRLLEHLVARIHDSADRKHHRPWACVDSRIVDACLVMDGVGVDQREAFDHVNRPAVEVGRLVQPSLAVLIGDVDD